MCSSLFPEKENLIVVDLDLEFRVGIDQVENNLKIFSNFLVFSL